MWLVVNNIDSYSIEWDLNNVYKHQGAETAQYRLEIIFNREWGLYGKKSTWALILLNRHFGGCYAILLFPISCISYAEFSKYAKFRRIHYTHHNMGSQTCQFLQWNGCMANWSKGGGCLFTKRNTKKTYAAIVWHH